MLLADIAEPALGRLAAELGNAAVPVRCDVADGNEVAAAIAAAADAFGGLDLVVNNAAVGAVADVAELTQDTWERVLGVSVGGVFHVIRHATPLLSSRGGGAIVNISSVAGSRAMRGMAAYAAAKAGVEAITRCAAMELRDHGIRVNAIAPGMIRTGAAEAGAQHLGRAIGTGLDDYLAQQQGRWGEPDEVAAVAVHLVSDESAFTSGQTYMLDNGASTQL